MRLFVDRNCSCTLALMRVLELAAGSLGLLLHCFVLLALSGSLVPIDELTPLAKTSASKQVGVGMAAPPVRVV